MWVGVKVARTRDAESDLDVYGPFESLVTAQEWAAEGNAFIRNNAAIQDAMVLLDANISFTVRALKQPTTWPPR